MITGRTNPHNIQLTPNSRLFSAKNILCARKQVTGHAEESTKKSCFPFLPTSLTPKAPSIPSLINHLLPLPPSLPPPLSFDLRRLLAAPHFSPL